MKRFLSVLVLTCFLLSMCLSLTSCGVFKQKEKYTWGDLIFDTLKFYTVDDSEEFLEDYEEFADLYVKADSEGLSELDDLKFMLGGLQYTLKALAIIQIWSAQMGDEYNEENLEYAEKIIAFGEEVTRITERLPEWESDSEYEYDGEYITDGEDTLRDYEVNEWRELVDMYEEAWDEYWVASDRYDADPSDTDALRTRDLWSDKIADIGMKLENIRTMLTIEADNGSEEAQAELDAMNLELTRINEKRAY